MPRSFRRYCARKKVHKYGLFSLNRTSRASRSRLFSLFIFVLMLAQCGAKPEPRKTGEAGVKMDPRIQVVYPIKVDRYRFKHNNFPCAECHQRGETVDRTMRRLGEHTEIRLNHMGSGKWCFDCHSANDRNHLHLANGNAVNFSESYKLCQQCHAKVAADWEHGIHGKKKGSWQGERKYFGCFHCHNAHDPKFPLYTPKPPPMRPEDIKLKKEGAK